MIKLHILMNCPHQAFRSWRPISESAHSGQEAAWAGQQAHRFRLVSATGSETLKEPNERLLVHALYAGNNHVLMSHGLFCTVPGAVQSRMFSILARNVVSSSLAE